MANKDAETPPPSRTEQKQAVAAFVKQLYAESGYASWQEFAREVGVLPSTISDWHRGENAPSGYNLLRLIQNVQRRKDAGLENAARNTDPIVMATNMVIQAHQAKLEELEAAREKGYADLRQEVESLIATQAEQVTKGLRALAKEVRALTREPAPAAPRANRAGPG